MRDYAKYVYEYGGDESFSFEKVEAVHRSGGDEYVYVNDSELYLCARVVNVDFTKGMLLNPLLCSGVKRNDLTLPHCAWFIYIVNGSIPTMLEHESIKLPWIMWQGHNRIWKTSTQRFIKYSENYGRIKKTTTKTSGSSSKSG